MLHNETVNVWSHILGVFAFIGLFLWSLAGLHASSTYKDIVNGDPHYLKPIENKIEVMLSAHSNASNIEDFEVLCKTYLNISISTMNLSDDKAK